MTSTKNKNKGIKEFKCGRSGTFRCSCHIKKFIFLLICTWFVRFATARVYIQWSLVNRPWMGTFTAQHLGHPKSFNCVEDSPSWLSFFSLYPIYGIFCFWFFLVLIVIFICNWSSCLFFCTIFYFWWWITSVLQFFSFQFFSCKLLGTCGIFGEHAW